MNIIKDDSFSNFHFACRNLSRHLNGVLVKWVCEWKLIAQEHCVEGLIRVALCGVWSVLDTVDGNVCWCGFEYAHEWP
jgi:hypothetical protein